MTKIGLTLPFFRDDPDTTIRIARAADAAGIDGVFGFDHLFRAGPDGRRPALDGFTMLGAIAAETVSIHCGLLVARATLRPAAVTAHAYATAARIAPGRVIAGVGAGDSESREENESFGLDFGSLLERVAQLRDASRAVRAAGVPTWVGGTHPQVLRVAAESADGWNRWGGDAAAFSRDVSTIRALGADVQFTATWGGLVLIAANASDLAAKVDRFDPSPNVIVATAAELPERLAGYVAAGAEWIILGPIDSSNVDNVEIVAGLAQTLG